jgi:hypothetical protein
VGAESRIFIHPERFKEWGPGDLGLAKYRGQSLQFAAQATLRPRVEYLNGHRLQMGVLSASWCRISRHTRDLPFRWGKVTISQHQEQPVGGKGPVKLVS